MHIHAVVFLVATVDTVVIVGVPGPPNPDNLPEDGKLKSEMMTKDNKRYYLDLKENQRGRFLRVTASSTCTQQCHCNYSVDHSVSFLT